MSGEQTRAILKAAKSGDLSAVQGLLAQDPSLLQACDKDGSTPPHCAAWKGHVAVVEALLDAGAEINRHNQNEHYGTTPLHAAAHGNQKAVAEVLLRRGAEINARNLHGGTPLGETRAHNAAAVAKLLRQHGAAEE